MNDHSAKPPLSENLALPPERLYRACRFDGLSFQTTSDLEDLGAPLGQSRALEALRLGVGIPAKGYNLYVMGSSGLGKHTTVREVLRARAAAAPETCDWCYINDFHAGHKPRVLRLPAGTGTALQQDMRDLVRSLLTALPAAFDSDEYRTRVQDINEEFKDWEEQVMSQVGEEARKRDVMLLHTPGGYTMAPMCNGEVISPKDFERLSAAQKETIQESMNAVREKLTHALQQVGAMQKEHGKRIAALDAEFTRSTVDQYIAELKARYRTQAEVVVFLDEVHDDIVANVDDFRGQGQEEKPLPELTDAFTPFNRYYVNVLVDAGADHGAPVIYEDNPTYQNLVGRTEHVARFGTLMTDFTLIKAGALHHANGGYLLLDAEKILSNPFAWEGLKRCLQAREVRIQSLEQMLSLVSTISLEPEPIPLDVKVVLLGSRRLYYLLNAYDPEFGLLFKVEADFAEDFERNDGNVALYARLIATLQRRENLRPMDRGAVARLIEYAARRAEDNEKISLHMSALLDVLREADYWARERGRDVIGGDDVEQAVSARIARGSQLRERLQEAILNDIRLIDTQGSTVAQVNGLVVMELGDLAFGHPLRITATARVGEGKVLDIEREVKLGGASHSKGVLILSAYLAQRFARNQPLSLSASLVFEQSYGQVDGDSASAAELCALLSALAELPLRQDIAITGSVNQHGQVQAIGGVNEKVEGFFDICLARGLSGQQGVIVPQANVRHLMLRKDVVEAARDGRFKVFAVAHVDEAMTILTGLPAGRAGEEGTYPAESVNGRVQRRLARFSQLQRRFASREPHDHGTDPGAG